MTLLQIYCWGGRQKNFKNWSAFGDITGKGTVVHFSDLSVQFSRFLHHIIYVHT